jgi:hypothetical protein
MALVAAVDPIDAKLADAGVADALASMTSVRCWKSQIA